MKIECDIADPVLRKTAEGLLALCGPVGPERGEGGGILRVTDSRENLTADPLTNPSADGEQVRAAVVLIPRGEPYAAPERTVFALPVPILLPEAAAVLAEAFRLCGVPDTDGQSGRFPAGEGTAPPEPARPAGEGGTSVSPDYRTLERGGVLVRLTEREAGYFRLLYERRGETVTREELLCACGLPEAGDGKTGKASNVTDVYIGYLRKKLRPLYGDGAILSVRGRGYVFRPG